MTTYPVKIVKKNATTQGSISVSDGEILIFNENQEQIDQWDEYSCNVYLKGESLVIQGTLNEQFYLVSAPSSQLIQLLEKELGLKIQKGKVSNSLWSDSKKYFLYLGILFIVFGGLSMYVRWNSDKFISLYSMKDDVKMGDNYFKLHMEKNCYDENSEVQKELDRISQPLLDSAVHYYFKYKTHILKDDKPNAFALPGGHIIFTRGFLKEAQSHEEILGVLAHEIGHVVNRHSVKSLIGGRISALIRLFIFDAGGFDDIFNTLDSLRYSRSNETEADQYALELLDQKHMSPIGLKDFFDRNDKKDKLDFIGDDAKSWFSTHPIGEERIALLNSHLDKYRNYQKQEDLTALQTALSKLKD